LLKGLGVVIPVRALLACKVGGLLLSVEVGYRTVADVEEKLLEGLTGVYKVFVF
jgi:hypothetical protein